MIYPDNQAGKMASADLAGDLIVLRDLQPHFAARGGQKPMWLL
jgi:hypothetical protein